MRPVKWIYAATALAALLFWAPLTAARAQSPIPLPFDTMQDQQARQRMVAADNAWMHYLLRAARDPAGQHGIENQGTAAAYAYLYTGDPTYAHNAWTAILPYINAGTLPGNNNNNSLRIWLGLYSICYRILRPTLSSGQRQKYIQWMNGIAQRARTGFFCGNANGLIGEYLGLCLWSVISAPDNPQAASLLSGTFHDSGTDKPYGGLDYNPALGSLGSARNAIYHYVTTSYPPGSQTGVWLEGTQYINASMEPLLLYTLAINQVTGQDHFPEVTNALPQIARNILGILANSLTDEFQFGDEEFPHEMHIADTLPTAIILARRLEGTEEGAQLQYLINTWGQIYGYRSYACRMYLCLNPFAPSQDFRAETWPVNGSGLSVWRSGWSNSEDSVFGVNTDPMSGVNHTQPDEVFRSFRLYRNGAWALDHPISYGGMGCYPDGNNTVVAGGKGVMWQHGVTAVEDGPDYCYQRSETAGAPYRPNIWNPPAPYISEQTGSVLFVHGTNKSADVVIVADRVNATNPMLAQNFWRAWQPWDAGRIQAAETSAAPYGPVQWILHTAVEPAIHQGAIRWDVADQHVLSQELSPDPSATTFTPINEAQVNGDGSYAYFNYGYVLPKERHWQVRETPTDGQSWHFFLHALSAYDGALAPAISRVDGNGVSGALVSPSGEVATLAVFGSNPAGRLVTAGFTLNVTTLNASTGVYLLDLDPSRAWAIQIDANAPVAAQFGPGGVVRAAFPGAGAHTLTAQPQ
ncbi:MAG TPA: hypothetical protein VKT32_10290 [Chthonomonadaceae bacterium]|nr:hypothetical protein [Chthonomonadaceae bacterium]